MKNKFQVILEIFVIFFPAQSRAMGNDDPLIFSLDTKKIEWIHNSNRNIFSWDSSISLGYDLQKFKLLTEGERHVGTTEHHELRFLYDRAITPYWNAQFGVRKTIDPTPTRTWLEVGVDGLAPYFIETNASILIGKSGRIGLQIELEKEMVLNQHWRMFSDMEITAYGHNDPETAVGSGLAEVIIGLRMEFIIHRKISPYIGVNWRQHYGNTRNYRQTANLEGQVSTLVAGVVFWF